MILGAAFLATMRAILGALGGGATEVASYDIVPLAFHIRRSHGLTMQVVRSVSITQER